MADPPWKAKCLEYLNILTGCGSPENCARLLCSSGKCAEVAKYIHAVCTCQPPYLNGCSPTPTPGCCSYTDASPIYVAAQPSCYCCCGDAAGGAYNAARQGEWRPVAAFVEGDTVYIAEDGTVKKWSERPVAFRGSAAAPEGVRVEIRVRRGGEEEWVTAHRDQPFLLDGGSLRRAGELVPGVDRLVEEDGTPVPVLAVTAAPAGEVHHLATTREPATSVDGHLLLVNGLVAGDYALQLADLDALEAARLAPA